MNEALYTWLTGGLVGASWLVWIVTFLVMAQFTILSVTLYLHRCQAHRGVDMHGLVTHPMRLWLWLSTAMVTKEWVAIHRKHHARCETAEDPHSPQIYGINKVVFHGVTLYQDACKDASITEQFGAGTPNDWLERKVYGRFPALGPTLLLFALIAAFGIPGIAFWALQMLIIPVAAAGVVNGLGHWWGYRNFVTDDTSTNLTPWAFLLGGEELHNNHHAFPSSARFALRRFEFDIGWVVLRSFQWLGLARIRRVAPKLDIRPNIDLPDSDTLKALLTARFQVMSDYFRGVILPTLREEAQHAGDSLRSLPRRMRGALSDQGRWLDAESSAKLSAWIAARPKLSTVYEYRQRLREVYERAGVSSEAKLEALREWCREAEASGIAALEEFAARLKGYALVPARG